MNITRPVIAIAGPPGSGKTALTQQLCHALAADALFYDDFQQATEQSMEEILQWMQTGEHYDRLEVPGFAQAIAAHKQQKPDTPLIVETPLGRHHRASGRWIDLLIWLDIPLDIALARNIQAFTEDFLTPPLQAAQLSDQVAWLNQYMEMYITAVRSTLITQQQRIAANADIILDGNQTREALISDALNAIQTQLSKR